MSSLKTIPGILIIKHTGRCIQILTNLPNYASIALHFKNVMYLGTSNNNTFWLPVCLCTVANIFSNKTRQKSDTLEKLIICMQQLLYKSHIRFSKFIRGWHPRTPFWHWNPESGSLSCKLVMSENDDITVRQTVAHTIKLWSRGLGTPSDSRLSRRKAQ